MRKQEEGASERESDLPEVTQLESRESNPDGLAPELHPKQICVFQTPLLHAPRSVIVLPSTRLPPALLFTYYFLLNRLPILCFSALICKQDFIMLREVGNQLQMPHTDSNLINKQSFKKAKYRMLSRRHCLRKALSLQPARSLTKWVISK